MHWHCYLAWSITACTTSHLKLLANQNWLLLNYRERYEKHDCAADHLTCDALSLPWLTLGTEWSNHEKPQPGSTDLAHQKTSQTSIRFIKLPYCKKHHLFRIRNRIQTIFISLSNTSYRSSWSSFQQSFAHTTLNTEAMASLQKAEYKKKSLRITQRKLWWVDICSSLS